MLIAGVNKVPSIEPRRIKSFTQIWVNFFKLIDTPSTPIPPVDNKPKIKTFGSFRWLVIDHSVVRKLTDENVGTMITQHFCPYDMSNPRLDPFAQYVLICGSTFTRFRVN